MDANTLCTLLAQQIPPEQFQLHGLEVVFVDPERTNKPFDAPNESPYDTPENRAIVEEIKANYPELAAAYELSQIPIKRQAMYKAEADPLYIAYQAMKERSHPDADSKYQEWLAKVEEIKKREIK